MRIPLARLMIVGALLFGALPATAPAQTAPKALTDVSSVPLADKLKISAKYLDEMRTMVADVDKMLKDAVDDKDEDRKVCLEKKLTTMKVILAVAEGSYTTLIEAPKQGKTALTNTSFRQINIMHNKMLQYRNEADACVDKKTAKGQFSVMVSESGLTGGEDIEPLSDEGGIDTPPPASQFQ